MKRDFWGSGRRTGLAAAVVLALAWGAAGARASGFSRQVALGTNGVARVAIGGRNVWKPVSVAVVFAQAGTRSVEIRRSVDAMAYAISSVSGTGRSFLYVFDGVFWFSGTNALVVAVDPPSAGIVEVNCE
jgi:hypothetical protein